MHVNLRIGTVMSVAHTATGRLFAAFMPPKIVEAMMLEDLNRQGGRADGPLHVTRAQVEKALAETRKRGLSRTIGQPLLGLNAFSAPVFDSSGHIVLGITLMGPAASFDDDWNGRLAGLLRTCAAGASRQLGFEEPR